MILLDTGVILAAFNKRDVNHSKCKRLMVRILKGELGVPAVTDYVIDEVLSYASRRLGREGCLKLGSLFFEKNAFRVIPTTLDIVIKAWEIYKERAPALSFTDSTLLQVAKTYKVDYLVTLDRRLGVLYPSMSC
ncbi:nucleotide-binding protein [Ignicoccus pacificus DSM 13166]|uniref:Nucleotide-binding protein n=1 Tax=Ignicoccus pacificus DSM 13166 TaxID=940294 RepID=A0A977K9W4_9CREN|nr:nucleotide-binding protein [Ignicoccus pacificus DSM 13166]